MPPDSPALEPDLRFSHPSVSPHPTETEKETTQINMWTLPHTHEEEVHEEKNHLIKWDAHVPMCVIIFF